MNGLDAIQKIPKLFGNASSKLLVRLTQFEPVGGFPKIQETVEFFKVRSANRFFQIKSLREFAYFIIGRTRLTSTMP